MKADDRNRLQRLLATFDENGLVALSNKGLVRRALKDLEAGGLAHEETDTAVVVRGPDWAVTMPAEGPVKATDTTKATGVTRQILMATVYLRDRWASPAPPLPTGEKAGGTGETPPTVEAESLLETLLAIDIDDLQKWAGRTILREAALLVRAGMAVEVESHAGLTIRLVGQEVEARLLPGKRGKSVSALLDDVLTTAPKSQHKRWVTVAVLALQQSRGKVIDLGEQEAKAEAEGAPLTRQQLLAAALDLLAGMVATGLAHPSARMTERLFTLSVSMGAANLPRIARLLRALSDDVSLVLDRSAAADTSRLFGRVCLTFALARALAAAGPKIPVALAGLPRTQYDPAGDLVLTGVGAFPWQTASGFEGVTVLFWEAVGNRFVSWGVSRPTGTGGFDLNHSYRHEAVWAGGSPDKLSRSLFQLRQAKANREGRLSASKDSIAEVVSLTEPDRIDFPGRLFADWAALQEFTASAYPLGLKETNPLDRIVVLAPARWGERVFDELQQRFCWKLADLAGRTIMLVLPWAGVNESAIEFLEAVQPERDKLSHVVARIVFGERGAIFEPLALLSRGTPQGHRVLNPAFDRALITSPHSAMLDKLRQKYGRDRIPTTMTSDDDGIEAEEGSATLAGLPPVLQARLGEAENLLLRFAESGMRRVTPDQRDRLRPLTAALDRLGLAELARAFEWFEKEEAGSSQVVWAGYLCGLYRQVLASRQVEGE
jgi:hypothetical protein